MFYLVIVQNGNTPAIFSYNSHDEALAAFHTELAYRAEGRISTSCMIIDASLYVYEKESWAAPVQTEEPQEG